MERSLEVAEDSGILDRIIPADLAEKTRQASVVKKLKKILGLYYDSRSFSLITRHFDTSL